MSEKIGVGLQDLLPLFYIHRRYGGRSLPYDYEKESCISIGGQFR